MDQRRLILAVTIVAVMAAPAASAAWYVKGTVEPDTTYDRDGGYMFPDPDQSSNPNVRMAYFNVWMDMNTVGVNPNVGATNSGIFPAPSARFMAMLGVWKDCNGDGFVGMADGALWEYRSALLLGSSICDGSDHIVGDWVWEFQWIGPGDAAVALGDARYNSSEHFLGFFGPQGLVNDTESRVWGDWGLPGGASARTCAILPPRGTTGSTGGAIAYADCHLGRAIQGATQQVDGDGSLGIRMDGEPQRSDSLLNQRPAHLWNDPYNPGSTGLYERGPHDPAFTTWDCSAEGSVPVSEEQTVEDPSGGVALVGTLTPDQVWINGTGVLPNYYVTTINDPDSELLTIGDVVLNYTMPAPQVRNPQGSYYEGANQTWNGAGSHCPDDGSGSFVYANPETDAGTVDPNLNPRKEHQMTFRFRPTQGFAFGTVNWDAIGGCTGTFQGQPFPPGCNDYVTNDLFTSDMPDDFGIQHHRNMALIVPGVISASGGVGWYSMGTYPTDPQVIDRDTLQPEGPIYATFYATVGQATIAKGISTPPSANTYGRDWCQGQTSGAVDGFDCDATKWWNPANPGTSPMPIERGQFVSTSCTTGRETPLANCRELGVKPGQPYQFRDIDCWDGRIAGAVPVQASLASLSSDGPCRVA